MRYAHILDRPIWAVLNGRQAVLGMGGALARRFLPEVNLFGAAADDGAAAQAALGGLLTPGTTIGLVEPAPPPPIPGAAIRTQADLLQMTIDGPPKPIGGAVDWQPLGDADAPEMLALATLTKPGPFFARTHAVGGFIGVRRAGRLVAMAGERMKPDGWTEVSAVCTHPDWRGHGFGPALMRAVIERAQAAGEGVFLHAYPDNPAVGLYKAMGFRVRRTMVFTIVERPVEAGVLVA